jgi:tetratricopeptide (TPR) repeat protein
VKQGQTRAVLTICIAGALAVVCASTVPASRRSGAAAGGQLEQAVNLYNQGHYAEAASILSGLDSVDAKAYLAACLAKQRKFAEAEATAKGVLEQSPTHRVAVAGLGQSLVGLGKYDEAVERLSAAITATEHAENKTDAAYAFFWRGQAHYKKGHADKMVADFEIFLKLVPEALEANTVRQLLSGVR